MIASIQSRVMTWDGTRLSRSQAAKGTVTNKGPGGGKMKLPLSVGCCFEMWYIPKEWLTMSFRKCSEGIPLMGLRRYLLSLNSYRSPEVSSERLARDFWSKARWMRYRDDCDWIPETSLEKISFFEGWGWKIQVRVIHNSWVLNLVRQATELLPRNFKDEGGKRDRKMGGRSEKRGYLWLCSSINEVHVLIWLGCSNYNLLRFISFRTLLSRTTTSMI